MLRKAAAQGADAERSLQHFDKDGSGEVDRAEFDEAMKELGFTAKPPEYAKLFAHFDEDGDGSISYKEFAHFAQTKVKAKAVECFVEKKLRRILIS